MIRCPECDGGDFMRAVRVVRFHMRSGLTAYLLGPVREQQYAINAACARIGCGCAVRIDRDGVQRLRSKVSQPEQAVPPAPEKPKPQMELHATPGMEWTRPAR